MAAAAVPVVTSLLGAGAAVAGTVASIAAGRRQEKAQARAQAAQEAQLAKQEARTKSQEDALNRRLSRKRKSQLAGRFGRGLGGRRSLFFQGNELGVVGEGERATLG